jgi:hypothetical protein
LNGKLGAILGACRPDWRGGVIVAQEGERWIVSLGGYLGDHAPTDEEGFLEFAKSLQRPDIYQVIQEAETLSPLTHYRFARTCAGITQSWTGFRMVFWSMATPCAASIQLTVRG